MEICLQNFVDHSNSLNKRRALIKFSFIQLVCFAMFSSLETQSIVYFAPEQNTITGGLHQGFVCSLYKAQISQYVVLVVIELRTAIIAEHNWMI